MANRSELRPRKDDDSSSALDTTAINVGSDVADTKKEAATNSIVAGFAAESTLPLGQSALVAALYVSGGIAFFLLIRYSKKIEKELGGIVYDNAAAVFFTELFKWTFSVGAMYYRTGKFLPISVFKEATWRTGLYYAVPSLIYAVYNNLTYYNLTIFDAATFQVFIQTRVLFTGLLYSVVFQKHLTQRKWLALCMLTLGVASKYLKWPLDVSWQVLFLLFQASLSAFAGVYNEFLLKRDISMDINEQNFFMYSFALVFNLGFGLYTQPDYYTSGRVVSNVNGLLLLIVMMGALMGITASLVLKYINVIVKAFASATEVLITAILAALFLGEALSGKDLVACVIVMGAIYIYYQVVPDDAAAAAATAPAAKPAAGGGGDKETSAVTADNSAAGSSK